MQNYLKNFGLRSWRETASSAATAAENKPVCSVLLVYVWSSEIVETRTDEDGDSVGVFLLEVGHLVVFFLCNFRI